MKYKLLIVGIIAFTVSFSPLYASEQDTTASEKPRVEEVMASKIEAIVEAVDYEKRMVMLKGPDGESVTIEVQDKVKNFAQVEVGDLLTVEYIEAVSIQVFAAGDVEPGAAAVGAVSKAELGQKPAGIAVKEVVLVVTIEAIDKDNQLVTLKSAGGESKTVKARNPDNLEKVEVGDKVMITYTAALGISVTEKPAEK